jgi:rhamnulose-1-phosphate aldolase
MTVLSTRESWFVTEMIRVTSDMWLKGWDERNGGNISLRLLDSDVAPYLPVWKDRSLLKLSVSVSDLAGQYYLVTGSGKCFRNIQIDPEANLGIIRILPNGNSAELLWGYRDGGVPTSELPAHLKSHRERQQLGADRARVVMHCHATNLIALTYVLDSNTDNVTRALWEGSTECLVIFPEGVGVMKWMVPGTDEIGDATAGMLRQHPLVLWPFHGVFAAGDTLDNAFGLIDTAEKAAQILVKVISMGGVRQTITTQNLIDLAKQFGVTPRASALALDVWRLADGAKAGGAAAPNFDLHLLRQAPGH